MKLLRSAALIGLGRRAFIEARKPENQAKIKQATAKVRNRRTQRAR